MFTKEEYKSRRAGLRKNIRKGLLLFLGNEESSINFKDNWYPFRQDSTFLYFFGLNQPGLAAVIDLDEDQETIFGDNPTIDDVIFTGTLPPLDSLASEKGVTKVMPASNLAEFLERGVGRGQQVHYLPAYRYEHLVKLASLLKVSVAQIKREHSVKLIRDVVKLRSIKSDREVAEIEKAVNNS